jgi:predicted DNA-binding protein
MKHKKNKLVPVSIRLEQSDKEKLETLCDESKSNKSEYLRNQVSTFLNSTL